MKPLNKKILIIAVSILLIIVIFYFVLKPKKINEQKELNQSLPIQTPVNNIPVSEFPLRVGSKGENVLRLQRALNKIQIVNKISEDSNYGNATRVKIITALSTTMYSLNAEITEIQLNAIIKKGINS